MSTDGAIDANTTQEAIHLGKVRGDLSVFTIFDLTQMMMLGQKSGLLTIDCRERRGYIYFDDGQIVSVTDDSLFQGTAAAFRVFLWQGGVFELDLSKKSSERNIKVPTENLMLDIARQLDEAQAEGGAEGLDPWGGSDGEAEIDALKRDRLRRINKTFREIATSVLGKADPSALPLLDILLEDARSRGSDSLFLVPGARPQIRVSGSIVELDCRSVLSERQVESLVDCLLPETAKTRLIREREVQHLLDRCGQHPQKVVATVGAGGTVVSLHTLPSALDTIQQAGIPEAVYETVTRPGGGILVVAGMPPDALDAHVAGLVGEASNRTGCLSAVLLRTVDFALTPSKGLVILRKVRDGSGQLARALRRTQEQSPRIVGLAPLEEAEVARQIIALARRGTSVVCGLSSPDLDRTLECLQSVEARLSAASGDETLLHFVRGLVQLEPAPENDGDQTLLRVASVLSGTSVHEKLARL